MKLKLRLNGWQRLWILASVGWLVYTAPPLIDRVSMNIERFIAWQSPFPKAGSEIIYTVEQLNDGSREVLLNRAAEFDWTNLGPVVVFGSDADILLSDAEYNAKMKEWKVSEVTARALLKPWAVIDVVRSIFVGLFIWLYPPFLFYFMVWIAILVLSWLYRWVYDGFKHEHKNVNSRGDR